VEWGEGLLEAGGFGKSVEVVSCGVCGVLGLWRADSKTCEDGDGAEVDGMRD